MGIRKKRKNETLLQREERCLHNQAWKYMSEFIRRRHADENGMVKCITCGQEFHWKEVHAGHYIPEKTCPEFRWSINNIHEQCPKCNRYHNGNLAYYTIYMIDNYGRKNVDDMLSKLKNPVKRKVSVEEQIRLNKLMRDYFKEQVEILNIWETK